MKQVEEWIAKQSFDGARNFLNTTYVKTILD